MVKFETALLLGDTGLLKAGDLTISAANDGEGSKGHVDGFFDFDQTGKSKVYIAEAPLHDEISTGIHEAGHALSYDESFLSLGDSYEVALGYLRQVPDDAQAAELVRNLEEKSKGLLPSRFRNMSLELSEDVVEILRDLTTHPDVTLSVSDSRQELVKGIIIAIIKKIMSGFSSLDQSAITILSRADIGKLATYSEPQRIIRNGKATRNIEVGAMLVEAIGMMIWENTLRKYGLGDFEKVFNVSPSVAHTRAFNLVRRAFERDSLLPSHHDLQKRDP